MWEFLRRKLRNFLYISSYFFSFSLTRDIGSIRLHDLAHGLLLGGWKQLCENRCQLCRPPAIPRDGSPAKSRISTTSTGNYSVLFCEFLFVRSLNFYLTQVYIPAALIVSISWLALWMEREKIAERMALGRSIKTILNLKKKSNNFTQFFFFFL